MKNNRHYKRYSVKCNGIITDDSFRKYKFQLNNMSACGMNITTGVEIKDTSLVAIHFDSSGILLPNIKLLKGKLVRKKVLKAGFDYAIRFVDLTHMQAVEIDEYLQYRQNSALGRIANHPVEDTFMAFPKMG